MARSEALGIRRLEAVHFLVRDIAPHRQFWVDRLDFAWLGASDDTAAAAGGQRSHVIEAGSARYILTEPLSDDSRAGRFLSRHPDGVGELIFEVDSADRTFEVIAERGGTAVADPETVTDEHGSYRWFSITSPFGEVLFTFAERRGYRGLLPGVRTFDTARGGRNRFGFGEIDHVTSNFLTLQPMLLWFRNVLGFEEYWGIEFHTDDVAVSAGGTGSGLKSTVMWDPHSGVKFANNEPRRPHFDRSQIYTFVEDNNGPGVQHTALTIADIVATVGDMRSAGIGFMPTPESYYEMLPPRMAESDIEIDEDISTLRELEILVDGEGPGKYLLQIFCKDFAGLFEDKQGGPFFLEIIQRKGDRGFGGGNFRALFESIEREQKAVGRV